MTDVVMNRPARDTLVRRGRVLAYLTIGWNVVEAVVAITAGAVASSTALIGFGIDSMIESASGGVMLWRLQAGEKGERRERTALLLVGISLLLLAAYVAVDAGWSLYGREEPDESPVGIGLAIVSIIVMPILARAKRKVAVRLGSRSLEADSKQTDICAYLSVILLAGLGLNWWAGWWWADPVAALIMVPIIAKEGISAVRGEGCECFDEACADETCADESCADATCEDDGCTDGAKETGKGKSGCDDDGCGCP